MQKVPFGQLRPLAQCYTDDPTHNPHAVEIQYRDQIRPETPVWINFAQYILPRPCWIVTRRARYDLSAHVWHVCDERDSATSLARIDGAGYPDEQFRVYRHGETVNWYDRSHCYQTGASNARLYEIRHGTRKPLPLGVGQLAATGLDVLGLGQPK